MRCLNNDRMPLFSDIWGVEATFMCFYQNRTLD